MILIWNMANEEAGTWISPCAFLNQLQDVDGNINVWQVRLAPVASNPLGTVPVEKEPFDGMSVTSWIWVALAEVTTILPKEKGAQTS